jgi:hypothetical protein
MITKQEYIEYLLSTPFNYTCTNMADHKANRPAARLSHDVVSDFLRRERFTPANLWSIVQGYLDDSPTASVIVDDSVQDKRYSHFIELVKKQYSGNEHGTVKGIGLVNFVHSAGNDEPHWPIDYRIFHPESDGKTKRTPRGTIIFRRCSSGLLPINTSKPGGSYSIPGTHQWITSNWSIGRAGLSSPH